MRLDASNAQSDLLQKNKIAIRAKLRSALTVCYDEAFAVVDVTGS